MGMAGRRRIEKRYNNIIRKTWRPYILEDMSSQFDLVVFTIVIFLKRWSYRRGVGVRVGEIFVFWVCQRTVLAMGQGGFA